MWREGVREGIERRRGRTAEEVVGRTETKESRLLCQRAMVRPQAFLWSREREGRKESSLFKWWQ